MIYPDDTHLLFFILSNQDISKAIIVIAYEFRALRTADIHVATVQIANELTIFAGLVRDSCESNACEINAYSFANTRTFREVLHINQSETRGPRTG